MDLKEQLSTADTVITTICGDLQAARDRISGARTSWLTADFTERPDRVYGLPEMPRSHAVIAVDGSQIVPDKHEATLCYLLNAASITLFYGTGDRPRSPRPYGNVGAER